MFFKRKAYEKLREWKEKYADCYSILLEGPDEWENRRLQSSLQKMNMKLIL